MSGGNNSGSWYQQNRKWCNLRQEVFKRDGRTCTYCGSGGTVGHPLHIDHILPKSKFPHLKFELTNLQVLCEGCNMNKGATPDWERASWARRKHLVPKVILQKTYLPETYLPETPQSQERPKPKPKPMRKLIKRGSPRKSNFWHEKSSRGRNPKRRCGKLILEDEVQVRGTGWLEREMGELNREWQRLISS